jgi:hypothetical protein
VRGITGYSYLFKLNRKTGEIKFLENHCGCEPIVSAPYWRDLLILADGDLSYKPKSLRILKNLAIFKERKC